jgi:ribosomal protein L11 methyltransferase
LNDRGERTWSALRLRVPAPQGDALLALLTAESLGAWSKDGDDAGLLLYFADREAAERARRTARGFVLRSGADLSQCEMTVLDIPDEHWLERYQAGLRPFPLASRFVVCPSGEGPLEGDRIPIRLVPGRAFGTGEHPTTRLCAESLERFVQSGDRWVDLGCGSGILAIVARFCGAAEVLAVDVDPDAIEVAREVLRTHRADDRIVLRRGGVEQLPGGRDGIVANILAPFFLEHAATLARSLRPGGTLIASGIDAESVDEVAAALEAEGLRTVERTALDDWRALALVLPEEDRG